MSGHAEEEASNEAAYHPELISAVPVDGEPPQFANVDGQQLSRVVLMRLCASAAELPVTDKENAAGNPLKVYTWLTGNNDPVGYGIKLTDTLPLPGNTVGLRFFEVYRSDHTTCGEARSLVLDGDFSPDAIEDAAEAAAEAFSIGELEILNAILTKAMYERHGLTVESDYDTKLGVMLAFAKEYGLEPASEADEAVSIITETLYDSSTLKAVTRLTLRELAPARDKSARIDMFCDHIDDNDYYISVKSRPIKGLREITGLRVVADYQDRIERIDIFDEDAADDTCDSLLSDVQNVIATIKAENLLTDKRVFDLAWEGDFKVLRRFTD